MTVQGFEVKGLHIGTGRPKAIVPLMAERLSGLLEAAQRAADAGAELLEWRVDSFDEVTDPLLVAEASQALAALLPATPVIATVRTMGQGGEVDLSEDRYALLVRALAEHGAPDLLDIEAWIGDDAVRELVDVAHARGIRTIVSHHDFDATPETEWMADWLRHARDLGADLPKLAVMACGPTDCLRLMEATAQVAADGKTPLLTMAMGRHGVLSRLAGECFGSALTFCSLGQASAPGQVALQEALAQMELLHATLA